MPNPRSRTRAALNAGVMTGLALGALGGIPRWVFGVDTDLPIPLPMAVVGFVGGGMVSLVGTWRRSPNTPGEP